MFFGPLEPEPEPLEEKKTGAGAAQEKNQEPEPLGKNQELETQKNYPTPKFQSYYLPTVGFKTMSTVGFKLCK